MIIGTIGVDVCVEMVFFYVNFLCVVGVGDKRTVYNWYGWVGDDWLCFIVGDDAHYVVLVVIISGV